MKRLKGGKGAILFTLVVVLAIAILGIGYVFYRLLRQRSTPLPRLPAETAQEEQPTISPEGTGEVNFRKTGNLLNWDSQTESYTEDWTLLYEEPGNPAISVKLIFNGDSLCDFGEGEEVCDKNELINGDRATVAGNINNGEVTISSLKKINEGQPPR